MADTIRLTKQRGLELYRHSSLHELGLRAGETVQRLHPNPERTYVIERNINYTNVCRARCSFCAFSVSPHNEKAYILSFEEIAEKIEALVALGGTQILLQGGLHGELSLAWYENMLRRIREHFPRLHIHAFSPPEISFFSQQFDLSTAEVLRRLRRAGLDTVPGGGAEILVDRVRRLISPAKCNSEQWLDVMRQAHKLGMYTTATMMFGHVEADAERIEHLDRIRRLQDESLARREKDPQAGCFTAFTCWPFQPGSTRLAGFEHYDPSSGQTRQANHVLLAHAFEQLKMTALARLYLDNIPNIQASWVTQGPKIGQLSLLMGCNDMGSLMMEENVVAAAGTTFALPLEEIRSLIKSAGYIPLQRDCYYHPVNQPAPAKAHR